MVGNTVGVLLDRSGMQGTGHDSRHVILSEQWSEMKEFPLSL